MTQSGSHQLPPRRRPPAFQPRFILSLLYLMGFFVAYCLVLIAPELVEVFNTVPTGPEQERAAERAAREAIAPRLPIAIGLSILTLGVAGYNQRLPGLRTR